MHRHVLATYQGDGKGGRNIQQNNLHILMRIKWKMSIDQLIVIEMIYVMDQVINHSAHPAQMYMYVCSGMKPVLMSHWTLHKSIIDTILLSIHFLNFRDLIKQQHLTIHERTIIIYNTRSSSSIYTIQYLQCDSYQHYFLCKPNFHVVSPAIWALMVLQTNNINYN